MTARADRLTKRAKPADPKGSVPSTDPASTVRVFVDALERLDCRMERCLTDAGIRRADLDDPDARIPCTVWVPMLCVALEKRPMKNAGMRLATVTPIGAFPLIDYLIVTSRNVGEGLERLARYLRIAEAPSIPSLQQDEDPIRVLFEGRDNPMSAEFSVTLNVLHFREETEDRFRAGYASFIHTPDDVAEMERVLGSRCTLVRRGTAGRCRARRGSFRCGDATRCWAVYSSDRPTRPSDACRPWTVWRSTCAARWPRASGAATRASRRLHGRWRRRPARFSAGWLPQAVRISNCWILRERTPPSAICLNHRCRSVRSGTCLAILNPQPSTERSGDGITKRHRRSVSADEMSLFVCPCDRETP